MSNVAPFGLSIALWSWDYDPLFVALWQDHDPCYRLLQTLMGTDHIRPVSLSKVRSDLPLPCFQYFFKWPVIIEAKPRTLGYYSNVLPPFLPCDWFSSSLLCFLVLSLNSVKILLSFGLLSLLEVCRGGWNLLTASLLSLSEPNRVSMTSKVYCWIRTKFKSLLFCLLFQ